MKITISIEPIEKVDIFNQLKIAIFDISIFEISIFNVVEFRGKFDSSW